MSALVGGVARHGRLRACLWLTCLVFGSWLPLVRARAAPPIQDFQTWTQLQATVGLDALYAGLSLNLEGTVRRGSPAFVEHETGMLHDAALTYLFLRPSLQLELHPGIVAALGYAYAPVYYDEISLRRERDVREQRVWEQLTLAHGFGLLQVASRSRLEERMRSHGPGTGEFELRMRQRFRAALTLVQDSPWNVVATDEPMFFLNDSDFPSQPGFTENRAFLGLGYKTHAVNVEFGYLNQYVGGPSSPTHRVNHVLSTSMTFTIERKEPEPAS